jgi:hypothetical protein
MRNKLREWRYQPLVACYSEFIRHLLLLFPIPNLRPNSFPSLSSEYDRPYIYFAFSVIFRLKFCIALA